MTLATALYRFMTTHSIAPNTLYHAQTLYLLFGGLRPLYQLSLLCSPDFARHRGCKLPKKRSTKATPPPAIRSPTSASPDLGQRNLGQRNFGQRNFGQRKSRIPQQNPLRLQHQTLSPSFHHRRVTATGPPTLQYRVDEKTHHHTHNLHYHPHT